MSSSDTELLSDTFQVEEIVSHKTKNGKTKFYIKWQDYPESENTWETEEDLVSDGLSSEIQKYTALNLKRGNHPRRRKVKHKIFIKKAGQLTPTGNGREAELQRRRNKRNAQRNQQLNLTKKLKQEVKDFILPTSTYYLTRIVFLRMLSLVYLTAFLVAYNQNPGLIGENGLLPAKSYWKKLNSTYQNNYPWEGVKASPNLLWFLPGANIDKTIEIFAQIGVTLSIFVLYFGRANSVIMLLLWSLYFSIDGVGQRWYSFGWESQLLETGFLAIFATPLLSLAYDGKSLGGFTVVWGYRWLIFRILIGAGLIKIRGDQCWRDLTCMNYHYETQPVPGPTSRWYHQNPEWFHQLETGVNHFVELIVPWMMLFGRTSRSISGCFQISFQFILISSGNLSFLNWLTIIPSLWCLDDRFYMDMTDFLLRGVQWIPFLGNLFSLNWLKFLSGYNDGMEMKRTLHQEMKEGSNGSRSGDGGSVIKTLFFSVTSLMLAILLAHESIPVVRNLLAIEGQQAMNTNFNSFKLVNTYGAFGSITKQRTEIILQGTSALNLNDEKNVVWKSYEFKCKPGQLDRQPCWITPYHYRLDWLMWFAAFSNYQQHPWLLHLSYKLLQNDPLITSLIELNPFENKEPPTFIRAEHYVYEYASKNDSKNWWKRKRKGEYFPPIELKNPSLQNFLSQYGWNVPKNNDKSSLK
jgi:hypothetical protein